ncbi:MAG: hypothetical protein ACKPJD_08215 [Planctomycetaceae bacterium]|jgi:hypothetical protein
MNRLSSPKLRLFNPDFDSDSLVDVVEGGQRPQLRVVPQVSELDSAGLDSVGTEDDADVISFATARRALVLSGRFTPTLQRARLIHANSECSGCGGHDVEPVELDDATVSWRNGDVVPGTATIIGFHCNDCGSEWPVYEISRRVQK